MQRCLKRHPQLSKRRRYDLEKARAITKQPSNLAEYFARLEQVYRELNVMSGSQIVSLDESEFSTQTAFQARTKAAMDSRGRNNSITINWSGNASHVTIMPVVSADGRYWTPIAILPGKRAKYRIRQDGTRKTPAFYLPKNALVAYRDPVGMDSEIFLRFCENFVPETKALPERHRKLISKMDGYGAHTP